jgi:hypothetical protein
VNTVMNIQLAERLSASQSLSSLWVWNVFRPVE